MNFCKFVRRKSPWKNEVDIKSVYLMSSEFELRSGESMFKILILIAGGLNKKVAGISSWNY